MLKAKYLGGKTYSMNQPAPRIDPSGRPGRLLTYPAFASNHVEPRNLCVWLPPGYESPGAKRYPVIYAHDGQNLFDPATAFAGVDWGIDEALVRLAAGGRSSAAIVVGVWNTPQRYREYDPQRAFEACLSASEQKAYAREHGRPVSDAYLRFLVGELKPFVDQRFRTLPGRESTSVLGSSMGGLISAYAVCEYPEVFGAAACLSTHWPALQGRMVDYLRSALPAPGNNRFYFDFGTETIDAPYEPYQLEVDQVLREAGYREGADWVTRKFPGADHSERAWRSRVDIPLSFLLAPEPGRDSPRKGTST